MAAASALPHPCATTSPPTARRRLQNDGVARARLCSLDTGSQLQNKGMAVKRLRLALATRVRTERAAGQAWAPGTVLLSKLGRKGGIEVGPGHSDMATVLADILDGVFWVSGCAVTVL